MAKSYTEEVENTFDQTRDAAAKVGDKISESAGRVKDTAAEAARNAQSKVDESRGPAAEKLESAATALHQRADNLPGGETVSGIAHSAADKMEATAAYVREHSVQDMMGDVETFVRQHPGQSLLAAAAVGFLVGRTFRADD